MRFQVASSIRLPTPGTAVWISAAAGGALGALSPSPMFSVESAQVMAGRVILPESSAVAVHLGRLYSLTIDLATTLLWLGTDIDLVSRVMTAVMGALSFAAVALLGMVFTRHAAVALVLPFAMFGYNVGSEAHRWSIDFPIALSDMSANAMSVALMALSLLALRSPSGLLLLGLLPALHVVWAAGAWLIVGAGGAFDRSLRRHLSRHWRWLAAGIAMAAAGWLLHQTLAPEFPAGDVVNGDLVRGERIYWDPHRRPLAVERWSFAALFAADAVFLLLAYAATRTGFAGRRGVLFWMIGATVLAAAGLANSLIDQARLDLLPPALSALAMSRWLNLNTVVLPPLALGLVWQFFTLLTRQRFVKTGFATIAALLAFTPFAVEWVRGNYGIRSRPYIGGDESVLARAAQNQGFMLAHSFFPVTQLYTSRPQLLDTTLVDLMEYSPQMGMRVETILKDVFGASLLIPLRGEDQLADLESRWAARSVAEWQGLARRYDITDVMVPASWKPFTLPVIASSRHHTLYEIPRP